MRTPFIGFLSQPLGLPGGGCSPGGLGGFCKKLPGFFVYRYGLRIGARRKELLTSGFPVSCPLPEVGHPVPRLSFFRLLLGVFKLRSGSQGLLVCWQHFLALVDRLQQRLHVWIAIIGMPGDRLFQQIVKFG